MILREAILNFSELPNEATIFAEKKSGNFDLEAEVIVIELTENELELPLNVISERYAPNKHYFLEIFIIEEILEDFLRCNPTQDQISDFVVYYADFDAFPEWACELFQR